MKKLFAIIALVAFFGAVASPAIAATFSSPIIVKVTDDKPKKAKATTETTKKDAKADCPAAKSGCCESKKSCSEAKTETKEEVKK
jgi:hypothetical protein